MFVKVIKTELDLADTLFTTRKILATPSLPKRPCSPYMLRSAGLENLVSTGVEHHHFASGQRVKIFVLHMTNHNHLTN